MAAGLMAYPDRIRPPMPQWQIDAITAQCIKTVYPDDWTPVALPAAPGQTKPGPRGLTQGD